MIFTSEGHTQPPALLLLMSDYNGYKNRTTWNAALWINNDFGYYRFVLGLTNSGVKEWKDVAKLLTINFGSSTTPDRCPWELADEEQMNQVLAEF